MTKTLEFIGGARQYVAGRLKFTSESPVLTVSDTEAEYLLSRTDKGGADLFREVADGEKPARKMLGSRKAVTKHKKAAKTPPTAPVTIPSAAKARVGVFLRKVDAKSFALNTFGVTLADTLSLAALNSATKELSLRATAGKTGAALVAGIGGASIPASLKKKPTLQDAKLQDTVLDTDSAEEDLEIEEEAEEEAQILEVQEGDEE